MIHFVVDIVMKDGTPKMGSVNAKSADEAAALVAEQFAAFASSGDAKCEEFARNIADYSIKATDQKVPV